MRKKDQREKEMEKREKDIKHMKTERHVEFISNMNRFARRSVYHSTTSEKV